MTNRRAWARLSTYAAIVLTGAGLAACASLVGPREVDVPLYKLQAGLERRFPMNNRALELLDIQLSRPQLSLQAGSDRIALTMDAVVAPPFIKQSWSGSLALSGRLYVDVARGAVMMGEPHVDKFVVDGMDEARQRQMGKVANVLVNKLIRDVPVYSFRMDDLRYAGVQFVPTRISSTADALRITLEPAR
ncbi:MAG TPA: DUF1439 domain-containing protein [Telluria sp.]|nr:DUF1439 domain-containing protein [Telluria sp.]